MIGSQAQRSLRALLGERVAFEVPMARHTSLRVGGPADALATPADALELAACLECCGSFGIPVLVAGGGFNLLVREGGWRGAVVRTAKLRALCREGNELLAEAGVSHSQITRLAVGEGLSGLEFAAGIPGSVGGWIAMNAGVPEREMGEVVEAIEVVDPRGERAWRPRDAMGFAYRTTTGLGVGEIAVRARFSLKPAAPAAVREAVDRHLSHRRLTQPVDQPSCGSVFKNPPGDHAGRLIEASGLKGLRIGGAEISSLHANFIVTRADARAADVLALIERVRETIWARSEILLEPEVRIVGEDT